MKQIAVRRDRMAQAIRARRDGNNIPRRIEPRSSEVAWMLGDLLRVAVVITVPSGLLG